VIPRKVPFKHSPSLSQILSPNEKILNRILIPRRVPSKHSPSISQMFFSNENSNRKDLSFIPNSQKIPTVLLSSMVVTR